MLSIIDVPVDAADAPEQLGSKYKFWYRDQVFGRCLFKEGRTNTGENWAEVVSSHLATLLGIPRARYELARYQGQQGVISPIFVPNGSRLVHGNELLATTIREYDPGVGYGQSLHTVRHVVSIMRNPDHRAPLGWTKSALVNSALDVFVGYVLLDAWIGNTDRHHENWGFINEPGGDITLAPSFDHASSLGRELTDDRRMAMLRSDSERLSLVAYAQRGRSAFYSRSSDTRPLSVLGAFLAFAGSRPAAAEAWLERLRGIDTGSVESIFSSVPSLFMSPIAGEFSVELLRTNREAILSSATVQP